MKNNFKQIFTVWLVVFSFISCNKEKKEPEKVLTEKEIEENKYSLADFELEENQEKIVLLSFIKKTPKDSIKLVIREYLMETESKDSLFEESIEKTAKKYSIPLKKVASIVFSYKYEALTEDEVQEKVIEEMTEQESKYNQ